MRSFAASESSGPSVARTDRILCRSTGFLVKVGAMPNIISHDATLAVNRSGELFTKNQVVLRLEGRFGFALKRPNAFVEISLTA